MKAGQNCSKSQIGGNTNKNVSWRQRFAAASFFVIRRPNQAEK